MILRPTHNWFLYPFFKVYTLYKIKRNFSHVHFRGVFNERERPVLVLSNHISWWDGFWVMYFNIKFLHRKFYFMMLEDQLKDNMFLNKTGGYSVRKSSRSIIESLDFTSALLKDRNNVVLMFPQGEIRSLYTSHFKFEKGIGYILKKLKEDVQIIFIANLIDYFSDSKPSLYICFREFSGAGQDVNELEEQYNKFYTDAINENLKLR